TQRLAEKREFHEDIEGRDAEHGHTDNQNILQGNERAGKADDVVAQRRLEGIGYRPEPGEHRVLQHHRYADGGDQRQKLAPAFLQRRKYRRVHQEAESPSHRQRHRDAWNVAGVEPMHEEIGGERAERHDIGMGEIDLDQDAVNKRQPQRHQDVKAAEDQTVDALLQDDRHLTASVPIPKFASTRGTFDANFGIKGTLPTL